MSDRKKIAVINLTRMGDLLMTGPLIDRLHELNPECEIHLFAVKGFMPIAEGMNVDAVIPVDFNMLASLAIRAATGDSRHSMVDIYKQFKSTFANLLEHEYEKIYNVSFTDISSILSHMLKGPVDGGMFLDDEGYRAIKSNWSRYFFAGNLNRDLNPFHMVEILTGISEGLSGKQKISRVNYELPENAKEILSNLENEYSLKSDGFRVILQCGASTEDKRWNSEYFGLTGKLLKQNLDAQIIFVGTKNEFDLAAKANSVMDNQGIILTGKTNLKELAILLNNADLLITNDTGTMHLAQSVGTRSLVLTLGTALSDETGPYGAGNLIVEPEISCFPCNFRVKCPHFNCHHSIKPESVFELAKSLLNDEKIQSIEMPGIIVWETGFDSDHFYQKVPVSKVKVTRYRIARELFRELWKSEFEPDLRPDGAEAERIASRLKRFYRNNPDLNFNKFFDEDIPAAHKLAELSNSAEKQALRLAELASESQLDVQAIQDIGNKLSLLDTEIDENAIVMELWRPLMMMLQFGRENLLPGGLAEHANGAAQYYKDMARRAKMAAELLDQCLRIWLSTNDKEELLITIKKNQVIEDSEKRFNGNGSSTCKDINNNGNRSSLYRPRLQGDKHHIIVLESGYFVQQEIADAFKRLGHKVTLMPFDDDPDFIRNLLLASVEADLLVTINHLGFDRYGELSNILAKIGLPYISWFVDRPEYILLDFEAQAHELAFVYTWERSTINEIRRYGFENVKFLPLATDPNRFKPGNDGGFGDVRWVANSMVTPSREWQEKAEITEADSPLFERAIALQHSGRIDARAALETAAITENFDISNWSEHKILTWASAVALTTTFRFRREIARNCSGTGLHVYGDEGWVESVPGVPFMGRIEYPDGLPTVYRGGIHLNCTNYQMVSAVNQRVFDIPLSGGILITDDQEDMHELFDPYKESILFDQAEDALERVQYFLKKPDSGKRIMQNAANKILIQHTYDRRAKNMLSWLKSRIGAVKVVAKEVSDDRS